MIASSGEIRVSAYTVLPGCVTRRSGCLRRKRYRYSRIFREPVLDVLIGTLSPLQVYKGMFGDGTMLAVKLLKNTQQVGYPPPSYFNHFVYFFVCQQPSHVNVNWTYK